MYVSHNTCIFAFRNTQHFPHQYSHRNPNNNVLGKGFGLFFYDHGQHSVIRSTMTLKWVRRTFGSNFLSQQLAPSRYLGHICWMMEWLSCSLASENIFRISCFFWSCHSHSLRLSIAIYTTRKSVEQFVFVTECLEIVVLNNVCHLSKASWCDSKKLGFTEFKG